jgi:hypothetical protein
MQRLLAIGSVAAAATIAIAVGVAAAVGAGPFASKPPVPATRADLKADPNGPATRAVTAANRALTSCFLANGATRVPNTAELGFQITGVTPAVHQACAAQEAAWSSANADPAYKQEQEALALVMNRAWSCVAARGFDVTGFSVADVHGHLDAQPGLGAAFAACKREAVAALGVTVP